MKISTLPTGSGCRFCSKEIIGKSYFSSGRYRAVYNIAPILPGHTLIIPNSHYETLLELSDEELSEMFVFARIVTIKLIQFFGSDGFDWTIQDGISAGQTVPHVHLHIIPRKPLDLPDGNEWYSKIQHTDNKILDSQNRDRLSEQEYNSITDRLAEAFKTTIL